MNLEEEYSGKFEALLKELKENNVPEKYWLNGFAMPKEIKEGALLFIGLNPSLPKRYKPGSHFYQVEQDAQGYFKKFGEIANACGGEIGWDHLDLLPIRHTNQGNVERNIVFKHSKIIYEYLNSVSKELLEKAKPKAVIVVNATARLLLGKDQKADDKIWMGYNFRFEKINGACYVTNSEQLEGVPFFFSGMLSGQRALDLGSYERLKWHVAKVLKEGN